VPCHRGAAMTTAQTPPAAQPGYAGRWWRWYVSAAVVVAVLALLTTPLRVSGWTPWGQSGAAAPPDDPTAVVTTPVQETPGQFQEDVLEATWSGSAAWPLSPSSGTVTVDAWVGTVDDADPSSDYYAVHLVTSWAHLGGMPRLPAPVRLSIVSDVAATSQVHGATRSFVSTAGCGAMLALPSTAGAPEPLGAATACRGYGLRLLGEDATSATWLAEQPDGLRQVEVVYAQKVPAGTRPVWTVELVTPSGRTSGDPWHADPVLTTSISATVEP
jgi:hypothetical protein